MGMTAVLYSSKISMFDTNERDGKGAVQHNEGVVVGYKIDSFKTLVEKLDNLQSRHMQIDRMIIVTHGNSGLIVFGSDFITTAWINSLDGRGYSSMFPKNARIFLNGCNIANKDNTGDGHEFLAAIARVFLRTNGGRAGASTSLGLADPFFSSNVYHLWGKVIYASIVPGGVPRVYAGDELPGPIRSGQAMGHWSVTLQDGSVEHYMFSRTGDISWDDGRMRGASGKGTWSIVDGKLEIKWNSGGRESWDMPIYSELQTGIWTPVGGAPSKIEAELSSARAWD